MFKLTSTPERLSLGLYDVLDTEDGVTETVTREQVLAYLKGGVVIEGITLSDLEHTYEFEYDDDDINIKKKKNKNLTKAKKAKNDEFYTQLVDIEKELSHYPIEYFKDKVIYCPTDVAINTGSIMQSQFVKYFQMNAHRLQFKKLIATCLVEKAVGLDGNVLTAQNCYVLERKTVDTTQRNIYGYTHGQGNENPVVDEVDDFGIKYVTKDNSKHPVPYHIINQAVTDANGKITLVKRYIDHYDEETGKPVLGEEDKGLKWMFNNFSLSIKWCRKHPDGTIEMLPDECYFYNNNGAIVDFSVFPKDENGNPCYEDVEGGEVCLYPSEYYDYQEYVYDDFQGYLSHCPSDETWGSGDFRSKYCTELLRESDIVVTNPPFSLFRDFIKWLEPEKGDTKFIVVGNQNAFTYKEIFPLIKDNKIWTGTGKSFSSLAGHFRSPYEDKAVTGKHIDGLVRVSGVCWFTNIQHFHRAENLILIESYDSEKYPKYDNYDAIEVSKTKDIPKDYDGVMGVPISFLHKYNPEQFEIIDINPHFFTIVEQGLPKPKQLTLANVGKKDPYARILIRKKAGI